VILVSQNDYPRFEIKFGGKHKKREPEIIDADEFIAVKSFKAKGKRLTGYEVASVTELDPLRFKPAAPPEPMPDDPDSSSDSSSDLPDLPDGGDTGEQMSLF
jgi:topoisomerase-4 subunit A